MLWRGTIAMQKVGLYDPEYEHDACGVGFVCKLGGESSHSIVEQGLTLLDNMEHRGAAGADAGTGDGAGIMLRIPDQFLREVVSFALPPAGTYGLGMVFLPTHEGACSQMREMVTAHATSHGWQMLGWRKVPVYEDALGQSARESRPSIWQFFVTDPAGAHENGATDTLERRLYMLRKSLENEARRTCPDEECYLPSLSCRTIVYKGMMIACQLPEFYSDLKDPRLASPLAIVHQRYSTNTFPSWRLAQPMRGIAHNGEINTIRGNRNWLAAREPALVSPLYGDDIKQLFPIIEPAASDSASLDNALEFLVRGGRSLDHAMAMLIPQAWGERYPIGPNLKGFYEYHAGLMEPWDGPAAVVFTDGLSVGACLDRNGLRPARYSLTDDGTMIFASESGPLVPDASRVVEKGSLRPGQMLVAGIGKGRLAKNAELKSRLARLRPWRRWVGENQITIPGLYSTNKEYVSAFADEADMSAAGQSAASSSALAYRQVLFGYDRDDLEIILGPMAARGMEPTGSMGSDIPLAVLDERPQSLFSYFRQQFAQITNPPIDSIREELVMSLMTFIGYNPNILEETPEQARLIKLKHPFLANDDLKHLEELKYSDFHSKVLDATFALPSPHDEPGRSLAHALDGLEHEAFEAVQEGCRILVISDRAASQGRLPIPSLLAVAAVNRKLQDKGERVSVGLVCETGEAREATHMAMLLSLGASAINPWLACETVASLAEGGLLPARTGAGAAVEHYVQALQKGLLKIMSKMGISTLRGYRGARIFEAVGLGQELMDRYFPGMASRVGGIGLAQIEKDAVRKWEQASSYAPLPTMQEKPPLGQLPVGGAYKYRRDGTRHLWTPPAISLLQKAVREGDYAAYKQFSALVNAEAEKSFVLRSLLDFTPSTPVPIEEVEPEGEIMRRFVTGAMSFGSLSREAHEALAIAMNSMGCQSNSGEGGEDPARYLPLAPLQAGGPPASSRSSIKQVASGRFGVTLEYLVNADELQIKIAQGAKPGEGGQLPGHKVNGDIARVRNATSGVTLISPPPHHDIYSIEDIAQLIYDLYQANDKARISVKLASETGVGTVAAGVAKAMAGTILISGFDGGTGASPLSSTRYAGSPWEIGLAEVQQTLALNGLRSRVRLQVDGQLKTGRDVVIASLLGADQFGFATSPLIALGCVMMRKCHTNGCPVGIATQDPKLRARFAGKPEHLVNLFSFIARDTREIMASLGFRSMDAMTGQVERLRPASTSFLEGRGLDFSALLLPPKGMERRFMGAEHEVRPATTTLDNSLLPEISRAVNNGEPVDILSPVCNTDRAVGTGISSYIVRTRGQAGLPEGAVTLHLEGIAGQSFGAFAAGGLTLNLSGEANDYVGKGLSGGRIIIRPAPVRHPAFVPSANAIVGNVALYGATSGELYLCGQAGERFAVRNSGAMAVVEGVGDHGCEYMTGGRVAILGLTGVNFAAGMSGGIAYVYDGDGLFDSRCNQEMVDLDLLDSKDEAELRSMLERHFAYTGSDLAQAMLDNWTNEKGKFVKVFPLEYRRIVAGTA